MTMYSGFDAASASDRVTGLKRKFWLAYRFSISWIWCWTAHSGKNGIW